MTSPAKESYYIGVYWGARPESSEACAQRVRQTLFDLPGIDVQWSRWFLPGKSRKDALRRKISTDSPFLEQLLERGRNRRDTDKKPIEELGFSLSVWNGAPDGQSISLRFRCGIFSKYVGNAVAISLGSAENDMLSFEIIREVLRILIRHFAPDWGTATSNSIDYQALGLQPKMPRPGWLTYLSNRFGQIPPNPNYECEPVDQLGTLIIATREKFSAACENHRAVVADIAKLVIQLSARKSLH
jgi:hypothetical protein